MDNKNANRSILFIAIFVAVVIITGTFAWLSWRTQNTAMVLTIGDIKGLSVTLKPYQIDAKLSPVSSYTSNTNVVVVDVAAANAKTMADKFKLYYKIDTIDDALIDSGFKYTIAKCTSNCSNQNNYTVLNNANGDFSTASSNSNLEIYQESIPANATYYYKVYLWIDSSSGNQSAMQNKSFVGELRASIGDVLYTMMSTSAVIDNQKSDYVTNNNGIQFGSISSDTNGKGIYLRAGTENDPYPIYYYRGAVDNNNVLFAGFCWKIVRTTNTGGIKLIYNGEPTGTNHNQCGNTTGTTTQLASLSFFNDEDYTIASPTNVGYMYGTRYVYTSMTMTGISDSYVYGGSYSYIGGSYTLTSTRSFAGTSWGSNYNQLNNYHYTCFNTTGTCNTLYYIFSASSSKAYYVTMPVNKTISQMLDDMLSNSTNVTNSAIKVAVDTWYVANMTNYTSQLENAIWCNDRSAYRLNGWDPNGGNISSYLLFSGYGRTQQASYFPALNCNTNDAFSLPGNAQGNGKLLYPVGLLTADEIRLAGGMLAETGSNSDYYLYNNQNWWSMSPYMYVNSYSRVFFVKDNGTLYYGAVNGERGVRPVVSLKVGTKFSGGTGIAADPYVVE